MNNKKLCMWLKAIVIAMAVMGLVLYFVFVPLVGIELVKSGAMNKAVAWAFFGFLTPTAIPCYLVLIWLWFTASDIGKGASFTDKNSLRLKNIAIACLVDTVYLFAGNLAFFFAKASTAVMFASFSFVAFTGLMLAVGAGCLSHLVYKAALMREENESFV